MRRLIGAVVPLGLFVLLATGCGSDPEIDSIRRADGQSNPANPGQLNWGDIAGGTPVIVAGSHLTHDARIFIGSNELENKRVVSSSRITGTTPQGSAIGFQRVAMRSRNGNDELRGSRGWEYTGGAISINDLTEVPPGISPSAGDVAGGTPVTISGSGFVPGTAVQFGTSPPTALQNLVVVDLNTITGTTPPSPGGVTGYVDVTVSNAFGTDTLSPGFQYLNCAGSASLTVVSVTPGQGPLSGGTRVTVAGTGLTVSTEIRFGGKLGSNGDYSGVPCAVIVDTPPGDQAGAVDVVANDQASSQIFTLVGGFVYNSVSITGVTPPFGPETGGTTVTITGSDFTAATQVLFIDPGSGTWGTGSNLNFIDSTIIQVDTPRAPAGAGFVDVEVRNANGTGVLPQGFEYLAVSIQSIEPNYDSIGGGSSVLITTDGLNLATPIRVLLGTNDLVNPVAVTTGTITEITGTVPAGDAPGPVDLVVGDVNFGDIVLSDAFVYDPGDPTVRTVTRNYDALPGGERVTIEGDNFTTAPALVDIIFDDGGGNVAVDNMDPTKFRIVNTRLIEAVVPAKADSVLEVVAVGASNAIGSSTTPDAFAYAEWRSPGPIGGYVTGIEIDRNTSDPNSIVYVGISGLGQGTEGGLYKSLDSGASWIRAEDGLTDTNVNALAMAPFASLVLYAGTPSGLFVSQDGAISWTAAQDLGGDAVLTGVPILSLAVDPANSSIVYAGSTASTIYRSVDGGANVALTGTLENGGTREVRALAISPSGAIFAGSMGDGVYMSMDSGATWPDTGAIRAGPPNPFILSLDVDPRPPNRLFAGTFGDGVYYFDGTSWATAVGGMPPATAPGAYDVEADPQGGVAGRVYAAVDEVGGANPQGGVWRSIDNALSWVEESVGLEDSGAEAEMRSLAIHPNDSSIIYAGALAGVFRTINAGSPPLSWSSRDNGISNTNVRAVVRSASAADTFAGTFGSGVYRSVDQGNTWTLANGTTLGSRRVQALALYDDGVTVHLYAGTSDRGVYRSTNLGATWSQENMGLFGTLDGMNVTTIAFRPGTEDEAYLGTNGEGVFMTSNALAAPAGGVPWTWVPGVPPLGVMTEDKIRYVTVTETITRYQNPATDPNQLPYQIHLVMAGTNGGGLFASTDSGTNWLDYSAGLPNLDIRSIDTGVEQIVDPEDSTRLAPNFYFYVGTGGDGVVRGTSGIEIVLDSFGNYRAELADITWTRVSAGLPNDGTGVFVNALAIDPNLVSNVFIGTEFNGVYVTGNGGAGWSQLDPATTLSSPEINDLGLVFDPACTLCTTVIAGTAGGGANRITILKQ